ncbi:hypothetical protein J2Y47_004473 [Arcicella sp. BE51]|nr:hypothetical protein [Arcicella sp. BE51]
MEIKFADLRRKIQEKESAKISEKNQRLSAGIKNYP